MEYRKISLTSKPGAALHIAICNPTATNGSPGPLASTLVVFLNGLMLPQSWWLPVIKLVLQQRHDAHLPIPALLTYDRFGQGESDPDPSDPPDTPYGHDSLAVVGDLHQLITQVCSEVLWIRPPTSADQSTRLFLICNSIGCPVARLYAAAHPGTVAGLLFLDSMMANTDFVSLFPNPEDPDFDPRSLPDGVSIDDVRHARDSYKRMFHPSVPNQERFDRRHLALQLPHADTPMLPAGPGGSEPLLRVVGHDWDEFAEQSFAVCPSLVVVLCSTDILSLPFLSPWQWHCKWRQYLEWLTELYSI